MATEVLAVIRLTSVADIYKKPGETAELVRDAIHRVALPEGRYGTLREKMSEMQSHTHDTKWGMVEWCGTLAEFSDCELLKEWWSAVLLAISKEQVLGVLHGVLQYGVEGENWVEVNHVQGFIEGMETGGGGSQPPAS